MAFSRSGAPAPTMSANTTDTTTARMTAMQQRAVQSNALQAASPAKPVEITSADGQHMIVSFSTSATLSAPRPQMPSARSSSRPASSIG